MKQSYGYGKIFLNENIYTFCGPKTDFHRVRYFITYEKTPPPVPTVVAANVVLAPLVFAVPRVVDDRGALTTP